VRNGFSFRREAPAAGRSRQKPRLLPAADEVMSDEIAAGNFIQFKTGQ
jgi:hypothetical protein